MWERQLINTSRGEFEIFTQGTGEPLCITHLYSEFNELGYYFADTFITHFKVLLVNLRDAGNSCKAENEEELSMGEASKDLEAIREALNYNKWCFAGHSTGGMLGLVYATMYPDSLTKLLVGGATSNKEYMQDKGSMYSPKSPLHKRLLEIFSILKNPNATLEERRNANKDWTDMSLYHPERRDEYFKKPSSGKVVQSRLDYYSFKDLPNYNIQCELQKVIIPTIVYCGKYDAQCPLVFSKEIDAGLKNSKLYIFERSNHIPYLEEKDLFLDMVFDFRELTEKTFSY